MVTDTILYLISRVVCIQRRQWMGSELCLPAVNVSDNWRPARKLLLTLQNPVQRAGTQDQTYLYLLQTCMWLQN